jgi:hypothetical protein
MKLPILAAALAICTAPALAQLHLNTTANDPVTGLSPADWEQMIGHELNGEALKGDPGVLVVSSMPVPITITCDKWELVGTNVYSSVKGNPTRIEPFSVTYIHTNGFDGYCKAGLVGHAGIGTHREQ